MATLATVMNRVLEAGTFERDMQRSETGARRTDPSVRVRTFANEDVVFNVKRIDNSRLVRQADPVARGACWKMIGSVVAGAVVFIGILLPNAYGLIAGFQIQTLKQQAQQLADEGASLEVTEAKLLSPARMEELAREQQF